MEQKIKSIGMVGGPNSGKTTAIHIVMQKLGNAGWKGFATHEMATHLFSSGVEISEEGLSPEGKKPNGLSPKAFQEILLLRQINEEDFIESIAKLHNYEQVVIFHDRGVMDGLAYLESKDFFDILDKHNLTIVDVRDKRYDAIFHLVTAADGAEEFYNTKSKNSPGGIEKEVRSEDLEKAKIVDQKTQACWLGHPHMRVIDNSTNFDKKIDRLIREIFASLGLPIPQKIEKKIKIKMPDLSKLKVPYQTIDIEQYYLKSDKDDERSHIRKRGQYGKYTYYLTKKKSRETGNNMKHLDQISKDQYEKLLNNTDPKFIPIKKQRTCFTWKNQYFEIDSFKGELEGLNRLQIESTDLQTSTIIPPWITIIEDVTGNKSYSTQNLAERKK